MPAIELSRLRAKVKLLTGLIEDPPRLLRELLQFYASYSDLTFQSGTFSVKTGNLFAFRTPPLINHEIENTFANLTSTYPMRIVELIDLLRQCVELEPRQLAATLLGALPSEHFDKVIPRLSAWALSVKDPEDLSWLFGRGTINLRKEDPEKWLSLLQHWLEASDDSSRSIAVYGLSSMISDSSLSSLPLIFKHLQPLLLEEDVKVSPYLETIIERLIEKSEVETLYFLKQTLQKSGDPALLRMVRRSIELFSTAGQESLKAFLRS